MTSRPAFDTTAIRAANPPDAVMARLGLVAKATRKRLHADCPGCGKRDKFDVDATSGVFNCFICPDVSGGDVIALVQCVRACSFVEACEWLGGTSGLSDADRARLTREAEARAEAQAKADARKAAADRAEMASVLRQLQPAASTPVQAYLEGRGLRKGLINLGWIHADGSPRDWPRDVAFHPALPLFAGPKGERVKLGLRPAMVCLARDARDRIVCLHRTFLDGDSPVSGAVVRKVSGTVIVGGDQLSVKAKQILGPLGAAERGVCLGSSADITNDPRAVSLVAEGIENALAVAAADVRGIYWAALSLDRLVGLTRPNAHGNRGFSFPPSSVPGWGRDRVVLGDNDLSPTLKDPDLTAEQAPELTPDLRLGGVRRAHAAMDRASARLRETGDHVAAVLPPIGMDFNNWLTDLQKERAA